jgi:hypothetical protein
MRALVVALIGAPLIAPPWLSAGAADGPISDPKEWCGELTQAIAEKNTDKMLDMLASGAIIHIEKLDAAQALSAIRTLLPREGEFRSSDFLFEQHYGQSFARFWYIVVFEKGVLFIRCEAIRSGQSWGVLGLSFETSADGIKLP